MCQDLKLDSFSSTKTIESNSFFAKVLAMLMLAFSISNTRNLHIKYYPVSFIGLSTVTSRMCYCFGTPDLSKRSRHRELFECLI